MSERVAAAPGREVSVRVVLAVVTRVRKLGHDPAPLFEGLTFDESDVRRRGARVAWTEFLRFWERAERLLGGPAGMEEMGADLPAVSPIFQVIARVFVSLDRLYLQMGPRISASHYSNLRSAGSRLEDGRLLYEHRTLDGSPIPLSFGSATAGLLRGYPRMLGLPEAIVEMTASESHHRFVITPPASRPAASGWGLLSSPLEPPPANDNQDFAAPEELLDLIAPPPGATDRMHDLGAGLLARPDLPALATAVLELLEREFFCRTAALWVVTPEGGLRLLQERHAGGNRLSRARSLSFGGRLVGRLDVDGEVLGEEAPLYPDFVALLPWVAMAVAARLEADSAGGDRLESRAREMGLTAREVEVLGWIREGKTNPEIATILGISPRTVHKHVEHLLEKMGAESRHAAARQTLHWQWDGERRAG